MALETSGIVALVAGSSVLAALVTQGVGIARDWWKANKDGSYDALYLALALESYAGTCASALSESETYESSEGHAGSPHGSVPDLPDYPSSIEWKPLGIKQTTDAMSFRVEIETAKAMIHDHWEFLDEEDVVPLVRERVARLGQKALNLAIEFRKAWNIVAADYGDDWNVKDYVDDKVEA